MIRLLIQVAFEKSIYNVAPSAKILIFKKRRKTKIDIFSLFQLSSTSSLEQGLLSSKSGKRKVGKKAKWNLWGTPNGQGSMLGPELTHISFNSHSNLSEQES